MKLRLVPSLVPVLAMALCASAGPATARDYGQHGAVWGIAEPDLLEQIRSRLTRLEASGETARLNAALQRRTEAKVQRPDPVPGLAAASATRTWAFDPTITVSADIRDARGTVIIARGTRVNPLDTVPLRSPLVFLDGDDAAALDWAATTFGKRRPKVILVSGAPLAQCLQAYAFGWAENMVQAALKSVPLGQKSGQRILSQLAQHIAPAVDHAIGLTDDTRQAFSPMLAILSAQHETQYSRLFRS